MKSIGFTLPLQTVRMIYRFNAWMIAACYRFLTTTSDHDLDVSERSSHVTWPTNQRTSGISVCVLRRLWPELLWHSDDNSSIERIVPTRSRMVHMSRGVYHDRNCKEIQN
jgi:hypothetical protein